MVRSGLHTLRKILPHTADEQRIVDKIFKKLSKATSKQPSKVNGKCIFFKSLVERLKARYQMLDKPLTT
eukprot:6432454-Lingulodinium_polyedra.AAC.1